MIRRPARRRIARATQAATNAASQRRQAGPGPSDATIPPVAPRVGLSARLRATLVHRRISKALSTPAAAALVGVVVVGVLAAIALGAILGAALVGRNNAGEW